MHCKKIGALLLLLLVCYQSMATHLRAGEIQVRRIDCNALTFEVTLLFYIELNSGVRVGGDDDFIFFGDGTSIKVPTIEDYQVIDQRLGIGFVKYSTLHTYNSFGKFKIRYSELNRNVGILNLTGSANTPFNIEASILIEAEICNTSPVLLIPPIDRACSGITFFHNPGAVDKDLDSLSFELVVPTQNETAPVAGYKFPNAESFYSPAGIAYNTANEAETGPPIFFLNGTDGTLTWDAPGVIGEYAVAIKIIEWKYRRSDSTWYEAGYVIRDMQIIVEECDNRKPELEISSDLCVAAGTFIQFSSPASDPEGDSITIEVYSDALLLSENPPFITPVSGTVQSTQSPDKAFVNFQWQTSCAHVRSKPYQIIFKISDLPPSGPKLIRFYTMNIKVVGPPPEYEKISSNPITKHATLEWKEYACKNITSFQIWRRISQYQYDAPECNTGIPDFLRYHLLGEIPGGELKYTDSNLSFGAQYCYRIVALVGENKTPSQISLDTCFIPKPAEAPVIVNVSVENTHSINGKILIRWTAPFDIDQTQYPPPYQYRLLRSNEADPVAFFEIASTAISDTVFTDTDINTQENSYRYKVLLYVPTLTRAPVDTSSEASSVFARTQPVLNAIDIEWKANTPWYNYSQIHPRHLIYRSISSTGNFTVVDSVNVNENDFHYRDSGQYSGVPLTGDTYYYKIKTRGTYGNPKILAPIENYSQITSGHVLDTIPPCKPVLTIAKINCEEFACDGSNYYTSLEWGKPGVTCDEDVVAFEILTKDDTAKIFTSLGRVTENKYLHSNLKSLNKCYRLISIDEAGNQSDTSDVVCNSNCLQFKLPNIITPGIADENNDVLTTFPDNENYRSDCSRSVLQVDLKIFSRWGIEIFATSITSQVSPVFWNGLNAAGREVSSGTYFYQAQVTFDTSNPEQRNQQIKGWVQVLR